MSEISKFSLRLPKNLNLQLRELAQQDNRSVNNYIIHVLESHVENLKSQSADLSNRSSDNTNLPRGKQR